MRRLNCTHILLWCVELLQNTSLPCTYIFCMQCFKSERNLEFARFSNNSCMHVTLWWSQVCPISDINDMKRIEEEEKTYAIKMALRYFFLFVYHVYKLQMRIDWNMANIYSFCNHYFFPFCGRVNFSFYCLKSFFYYHAIICMHLLKTKIKQDCIFMYCTVTMKRQIFVFALWCIRIFASHHFIVRIFYLCRIYTTIQKKEKGSNKNSRSTKRNKNWYGWHKNSRGFRDDFTWRKFQILLNFISHL